MDEETATQAAETFRRCGWDVWAKPDKIGGWVLYANPAQGNGDGLLYGFSHNDMKTLVLAGQVASRKADPGCPTCGDPAFNCHHDEDGG